MTSRAQPLRSHPATRAGLLAALLLGAALPQISAQIFNVNPGFETARVGSSVPSAADGTFAGTNARIFSAANNNISMPNGWTYAAAGNGRPDRWVYAANLATSKAKEGRGYAYISTTGNYVTGNDDCIQGQLTGLTVGISYTVNYWAADAGSYRLTRSIDAADLAVSVNTQADGVGNMANRTRINGRLIFELQTNGSTATQLDNQGNVITPQNGVWAFSADLTKNTAWSDTAATTIPWQQVSFTFYATQTTMNYWFSTNAPQGVSNEVHSVVFDATGFQVNAVPVPEPASYGFLSFAALALGSALRRPKRLVR
jgi:hypothetical protein